jgi:uncharacterized protein YjeT (DUF2065 family)
VKRLVIFFLFSYLETRSGRRLAAEVVAYTANALRQYGFVAVLSGRLLNVYKLNVYSYVYFSHCDLSQISDVIISDVYFIA